MGKKALYGIALLGMLGGSAALVGGGQHTALKPQFQTSDRCLACHNGIVTPSGEDISIGFAWRSSMMGNSSRDPYWQGSVRRESIDHPESVAAIEDECSVCHMPITRFEAKVEGRKGQIFSHLPFDQDKKDNAKAEDGVSCSVCHQIAKEKLGTAESFNGGFVVNPPASKGEHPEYGPFAIDNGRQRIMHTSSAGFRPTEAAHIRDSALCSTCHTLKTKALGPGGKEIGSLPEQMPYPEWLHSDYVNRSSCQSCHMPEIHWQVPITAVLGVPREGAHQHTFVAGNFFMLRMLNLYRKDLSVMALPTEMTAAAERTVAFLQSQSARVSIRSVEVVSDRLQVQVLVQNLTGHKLPTGFKKETAEQDIAVVGDAADDPNFSDAGSLVRYAVSTGTAQGPFHVEVELWYQPIGFRWAHNLAPYQAEEPQRFVGYYESMSGATAVLLTRAEARH